MSDGLIWTPSLLDLTVRIYCQLGQPHEGLRLLTHVAVVEGREREGEGEGERVGEGEGEGQRDGEGERRGAREGKAVKAEEGGADGRTAAASPTCAEAIAATEEARWSQRESPEEMHERHSDAHDVSLKRVGEREVKVDRGGGEIHNKWHAGVQPSREGDGWRGTERAVQPSSRTYRLLITAFSEAEQHEDAMQVRCWGE